MFTFAGIQDATDGYGYSTLKIASALQQLGVGFADLMPPAWANPQDGITIGGDVCAMMLPEWLPRICADRVVIFTMHEGTRLPIERVHLINRLAAGVIVPCEWNDQVFRDSGVKRPIKVCHLGVDAQEYPFLKRAHEGRPYTFLWSGTGDYRKGWDVAYKAFRLAFGSREDVRLVLHFRQSLPGHPKFTDTNVETRIGIVTQQEKLGLLGDADCFVYPSRGEGWGLPPREAAATGLPVIATFFGGLAEDIGLWGIPLNITGMSQAKYGEFENGEAGKWAEPSVNHLSTLMKLCASGEHSINGYAPRMSASKAIAKFCNWKSVAENVAAAMKELLNED